MRDCAEVLFVITYLRQETFRSSLIRQPHPYVIMRPPLFSPLTLIAMLTLGLLSSGCSYFTHRASNNRVAIALTVNGTEQPNAKQWAHVVDALKPELTARGLVLVKDLADADRILRIDFIPDVADPDAAGNAVFLGWRTNPLRAISYASTSTPATSLSYVNYSHGLSAYNSSLYGYDRYSEYNYGYGYGYDGGYSGGTTTVTTPTTPPVKPDHPGRHHEDHPPGSTPPPNSGPGRWVGYDHHHHPDPIVQPRPDRPIPPAQSYTSSSSGSSSSYSSSSGSYTPSSSSSYSSSSGSYSSSSSSSSAGVSSSAGMSSSSSSSSNSTPSESLTHKQN